MLTSDYLSNQTKYYMADRDLVRKDQPSQQHSTPAGKNYLLAIAINDYQQCATLSNAVLDVEAFIEVMSNRYHFSTENTTIIKDAQATKKRIENEFLKLIKLVKPQDNLVIYFSGHGRHDEEWGGNWVPVEAGVAEDDWPDYLTNDQIKGYLSRINSRHTFLIADSCFSGAFVQDASKNLAGRVDTEPSRWVLTSGKTEIVSDGRPGQHSPFAKVLLEELRKAQTHLGVMELCAAVQLKVASNSVQTPVGAMLAIPGNQGGQMVLYLQKEKVAGPSPRDIWEQVDREDRQALLLYIQQNPGSPFIAEAAKCLIELFERPQVYAFIKPESRKPTALIVPENMVLVDGGTFEMGGGEDKHKVTLSDFYMAKFQTTFEEYDVFCEAIRKNKPADVGWDRAKRPVINVNWYDAVAYCNWLSQQENLQEVYQINQREVIANWEAYGYRLPTEAEWEYAARGGQLSRGFQLAGSDYVDEVAWYWLNSAEKTHPVGEKKANELDLYDLSGNVWEWCWDWYEAYNPNSQLDPKGPNQGNTRVVRGGSWFDEDYDCLVSYRLYDDPYVRLNDIGFRILRRSTDILKQ